MTRVRCEGGEHLDDASFNMYVCSNYSTQRVFSQQGLKERVVARWGTGHLVSFNVRLQARAARGASLCKPLFGGTRT